MSESTKHETIYLQVCDDEDSEWCGEITWCEDRIHDEDVEYVRADLVEELRQQLAEAQAEIARLDAGWQEANSAKLESDLALAELADKVREAAKDLERQLAESKESEALAKQVAIQSQEDAKNQYQKRVELEKFIEGKNGYKERIQQLYEENLRLGGDIDRLRARLATLGNEQIDLADKVREECAQVCEEHPDGLNMIGGHFVACAAAIRAMKERP